MDLWRSHHGPHKSPFEPDHTPSTRLRPETQGINPSSLPALDPEIRRKRRDVIFQCILLGEQPNFAYPRTRVKCIFAWSGGGNRNRTCCASFDCCTTRPKSRDWRCLYEALGFRAGRQKKRALNIIFSRQTFGSLRIGNVR